MVNKIRFWHRYQLYAAYCMAQPGPRPHSCLWNCLYKAIENTSRSNDYSHRIIMTWNRGNEFQKENILFYDSFRSVWRPWRPDFWTKIHSKFKFCSKMTNGVELAFYQNLYLVLNTVVIGMVRFKPKFAPIQTYSLLKILIYKLENYQIIKNY